MVRGVISILLSFLLLTQSWAQDLAPAELVEQASKELDFELKFARTVLKISEELNLIDPTGEKILNHVGEKLPEPLDKPVFELFDLYAKHYLTQPLPDKAVRKMKDGLQWPMIRKILKESTIGADVFFKKKGLGVSIALILGFITEYSMYFILMNINPALLPISALIPYGTTYAFFPGILRRMKEKKKLIDVLGSKEAYNAYIEQKKLVMKNLHLKHPESIILPLKETEGLVEAVVMPKAVWWRKVLQYFGLSKDTLTYSSLNVFLLTQFENDDVLRTIRDLPEIGHDQKTAMMVRHIFSKGDDDLILSFRQKFGQAFISINQRPMTNGLKEWTKKMLQANGQEEILKLFKEIPSDASPREVAIIWQDILMPSYIENMKLGYFEARRMMEEFVAIEAKMKEKYDVLDREAIHEFSLYIARVWNKKQTNCSNAPAIVFKKLIKL